MLRKKRGMAIIEFLFFFFVFIFFFALMYGSWGITHSAILSSIGARAYAWDVIRNRSNLAFIRDYGGGILEHNYWNKNSRVFTVTAHNPSGDKFHPRKLKIDMGGASWEDTTNKGFTEVDVTRPPIWMMSDFDDTNDALALGKRNDPASDKKTGVVHLRMAYGICLNSDCDAP